jgi:hypothetical protein
MSAQISLSFELVSLLNWLLRHEKTMLNSIVKHALEHGFAEELEKIDPATAGTDSEELYNTVLDFLDHLEDTLIKNLESVNVDNKTKDAIMPTLHKLEGDNLDQKTLWLSMQQTKARILKAQQTNTQKPPLADAARTAQPSKLEHHRQANEILFEQLLKNWKPNNKETMN